MYGFKIIKRDGKTGARKGILKTAHGDIETPIFMPVGTQATVKALTPQQLKECNAQIILSNTYHLFLRPGHRIIEKLGGLHRFMNWKKPILTDSGGYQVFSLAELRKITEEGVEFKSHLDGSVKFISPEIAIEVQDALNSDIVMVLDECPPYPSTYDYINLSLSLTIKWAKRAKQFWTHSVSENGRYLFGIVQGGMIKEFRRKATSELIEIGFDGYAIGGLSVGEPKKLMYEVLDYSTCWLPDDKPRYLMGVGKPEDILFAVERGIDMFDCVLPTRNARNGQLFTRNGPINIKREEFKLDDRPVEEGCDCYTCRNFSRAYLRHLFHAKEILSSTLNTIHNVRFFLKLMEDIRESIENNRFKEFKENFLNQYNKEVEVF